MFFTIILPAYNAKNFISLPLDSLQRQTFRNFELIIVDDGSNDKTKEKVMPYLKNNQNWKYYYKDNHNWGSVINYVIAKKLIKGQYVTILDADDWFLDHTLELVHQKLTQDPQIDLILSKILRKKKLKIKKLPVILFKSKYLKSSHARSPISTPHGKFYKKELFEKAIKLRQDVSYQDTILFNDLISKASLIYYLNKVTTIWWYDRPGNSTQQIWDQAKIDIWIDNIETIDQMKTDREVSAYALMYLWELRRHTKKPLQRKAKINLKGVRFYWVPWYVRIFFPIKTYFRLTTRKYRK